MWGRTRGNYSYEVGNYNVNNHLSAKSATCRRCCRADLSNYDSLQAKINRSFRNGYSILGSYTYAHGRDNGPAPFDLGKGGNYPQNPFNLAAEYANSDTDLRHHFSPARSSSCPSGRKALPLARQRLIAGNPRRMATEQHHHAANGQALQRGEQRLKQTTPDCGPI